MALSQEEIQNLSDLFLSKDDSNTHLAFEIMEPHEFAKELITEIFVVYKLTREDGLRNKAKALLEKHGSYGMKNAMNRKLEFQSEKTIKTNISKYVNSSNSELDGIKFARALYNKYDKGFAYLMKEGNSEEITDILEKHIEGKKLTLNRGLTAMPKEFFAFTDLEEISLRGNKIANLNAKFKVFKNLKKLDLSHNCLKKIHPSLKTLTHLEELNISHNLLEEFPEVIGEFPNLRKLDLGSAETIGARMDIPENFFNLKLNYLRLSLDGSNGYDHNYKELPFFHEITVEDGKFIKMNPLDLAKQAFEQGAKSSIYFLFLFAESEYKTKVLEKFYDLETKTLDLSTICIKNLPEEIAQFDIKVLKMQECRFASNTYSFEKLYKNFPDWEEAKKLSALKKLNNLEEIYLDDNMFREIPESIFFCERLRILSLNRTNISTLTGEISKLKNLTHLNLQDIHFNMDRKYEFPDEMKELTSLTRIELDYPHFVMGGQVEEKKAYLARLKELFGNEEVCPIITTITGWL